LVGENAAPDNVDEWTDKITALLQNPDKLKEYGDACRPYIAENFRWEKVVDRLEKALELV
jgi:glycosyltransferase involved in cell wall biosynthesis